MLIRHRRSAKGSLAEFPFTLIILFLFICFPLVNLLGIVAGAAGAYLITQRAAVTAASQQNYELALSSMEKQSHAQYSSVFARFLHLTPKGGYGNCGVNLYVVTTNWEDKKQNAQFGPNTPVPPPVDVQRNIYQCSARSCFDVGPAIALSGIPYLSNIAGLGKPVTLSFTVDRMCEHPAGLEIAGSVVDSKLPATLDSQATSTSHTAGQDGSGWNYADLYKRIQGAGETALDQSVLTVHANDPNWTPTGLTLAPGQKLWIDYKTDGVWRIAVNGATITTDANGNNSYKSEKPVGALIGATDGGMDAKMPPIPNTEPTFFIGKQSGAITPKQSGTLYLGAAELDADDYGGSSGIMIVRIVLTQSHS